MEVPRGLRAQDWGLVSAQLTAFAFKRTQKRSWDHAAELAQEAIANLWANPETWDPEKEPVLKHLARRVIGLASTAWRRKRTRFEEMMDDVAIDEAAEEAGHVATERPDEIHERHETALAFTKRLHERLAGDETAVAIFACFTDGTDAVAEQMAETGLTLEQVRGARRRIFYHREKVAAELNRELDLLSGDEEVAQ